MIRVLSSMPRRLIAPLYILWLAFGSGYIGCAHNDPILLPTGNIAVFGRRPPLDDNLFALLPDTFDLATYARAQTLQSSPFGKLIINIIEDNIDTQIPFAALRPYIERTTEALAIHTIGSSNTSPGFVAAIKGDLNATDLLRTLRKIPRFQPLTASPFEAISHKRIGIVTITDNTILIGTLPHIQQTIDIINTRSVNRALVSHSAYRSLHTANEDTIVSVYRRPDDGLPEQWCDQHLLPHFQWIRDIDRATITARIRGTLAIRADATMQSSAAAKNAQRQLTRTLTTTLKNPLVRFLGLKWLLKKVRFESPNRQLRVHIDLSAKEFRQLFETLAPILKIQKMLSQ